MVLRIADTFTASLAKLTGSEQKATKTTAFDLQMDPASPGMRFHRVDRAKDPHFWSVRVSSDIRIIVHKTDDSLLLCYVDHHDKAYAWAERRKLTTHPKTGAAQFVEIREKVQEVLVPTYVNEPAVQFERKLLFADYTDDQLLEFGVPPEWIPEVRKANEESLLELSDHLPAEAAECLLELATGGTPVLREVASSVDPFDHPDAQRRFRVMTNVEELKQALEYPWEKWTVFLHPDQREWVERDYNGPARVSGSAGTGKTIVALHRAVHLARNHPEARVLLTTFSEALANSLRTKLRRLISGQPHLGERLEVHSLDSVGLRLYKARFGEPSIAEGDEIRSIIGESALKAGVSQFSAGFLFAEWEQIVDAWQLTSWEAYRDVARLGRKTRLPEKQRRVLWGVFSTVFDALGTRSKITQAGLFSRLADALRSSERAPYDFAIVDEAQDLNVSHLKFFASLAADKPNGVFFAGDLGQRIFQMPFSWKALGVDIRGRSRNLRVNYRTSHQIRSHADRLLDPEVSDVDGNTESRNDTISVLNGPPPEIAVHQGIDAEVSAVAKWIEERGRDGVSPHEIGVFVRSNEQIDRAKEAVEKAGMVCRVLDEHVDTASGHVSVGTMHLAKGLEFRAVVVMGCDDEVIPLQSRIEAIVDEADLEDVYRTERHLLYVACTRARDRLLITSSDAPSEFLEDMFPAR